MPPVVITGRPLPSASWPPSRAMPPQTRLACWRCWPGWLTRGVVVARATGQL
jgi:hypothetical protein